PNASRKNVMVSNINTVNTTVFVLLEAIIMYAVKMPQANRYVAMPVSLAASHLPLVNHQNEIQNAPNDENAVAPKTLPLTNSHIPAANCAIPPYARASQIGRASCRAAE